MTLHAEMMTDLDMLQSLDISKLNVDATAANIILALANDALVAHELLALLGSKTEVMTEKKALLMAGEVQTAPVSEGAEPFALQSALVVLAEAVKRDGKVIKEGQKALATLERDLTEQLSQLQDQVDRRIQMGIQSALDEFKPLKVTDRLRCELTDALDYIERLEIELQVPKGESYLRYAEDVPNKWDKWGNDSKWGYEKKDTYA